MKLFSKSGKNYLFLVVFLLAVSVVLSACSGGNGDTKEGNAGAKEIRVVLPSEPPTLNAQLATDVVSGAILDNVFEGLTGWKGNEIVMAAAEDVKISDDQKTYTFTLRDAKWSNGDPVTAADFEYAWEYALNPKNNSEYASMLYPIQGAQAYNSGENVELGIQVIDDKTLEVTLENPTPYFLELTAFKTYFPVHKATAEANGQWYTEAGDTYVTNGPYKLAEWKHSASIILEKNNDYWDSANVKVEKVNIAMVENETTAGTMFDSNEIDFLGNPYQVVPLESIERYKGEGSLNVVDSTAVYFYKFNTTGKYTKNANIRKALTLAIDRQGLIDNITKGEQKVALGLVPPAVSGFEADRGYFKDNDIEAAKAALEQGMKELGIANASDIKLGLSINTSEAHAAIAQYIQEGWRKALGIEVTIDNSEWQVYLDKLNTLNYDIGRLGWVGDYNDAYTFLELYDTADNGNNDTGWENKAYKDLLTQSLIETDANKRIDLLKQAEAIIMEELPVAPIYYYTDLYVKKDYVQNMEPNALSHIYFKYVDITK